MKEDFFIQNQIGLVRVLGPYLGIAIVFSALVSVGRARPKIAAAEIHSLDIDLDRRRRRRRSSFLLTATINPCGGRFTQIRLGFCLVKELG